MEGHSAAVLDSGRRSKLKGRSSAPLASADETSPFFDKDSSFCRRKIRMIWGILYCLLLAGCATLAFLPIQKSTPLLLCSCDVVLLVVTGIFQQHLVYQVRTVRLQGYYSASQKLDYTVHFPFAITAYGTAAMLLVMVLKPQISILSVSAWLRIIMLIEAVCAASCMGAYIGHVHQFNSSDGQPDVLKPLESPLQPSTSLEGLRYHDGGQTSDQLMALLQYQQGKLHDFSEEILRLNKCLSKSEQSDSRSPNEVDLAHMLAARDRELRIRSAEMSELQSKLRAARSTIVERDAEIRRDRDTKNQAKPRD